MNGHPLYLIEQGAKLGRQGRRLVVSKDGQTMTQIAAMNTSQVVIFGNVQITTQAMKLLMQEGIDVAFLSRRGQYYGRLIGPPSGHGALRVAQVLAAQDGVYALTMARQIVHGKCTNMRIFLMRYGRRSGDPALQQASDRLNEAVARIPQADSIPSLLGIEGQATAIYFGVWKKLLKSPWTFERRRRRPPPDPVNALISFAYTLLTQNVTGAVMTSGLDPQIGFLHQVAYNRPGLALDLVEEFRTIVADSVALRCFNNGIIRRQHFQEGDKAKPIRLSDEGIRLFLREFERRLSQTFKHPITGEKVSFRRLFMLQAYEMARAVRQDDGQPYRPFLAR